MAERQGSPGAALGIVVATLVVTALLGGCVVFAGALGTTGGNPVPLMIGFGGAAAVVLVGGLAVASIVAWQHQEGTGYWGRRSDPLRSSPAPVPLSAVEPLASPFRFFATRSAPVLAPDTLRPLGSLERNGEYTAVGVSGAWVLVEDRNGRQGWAPDTVVPARQWRRHREAVDGGREGGS